MISTEHVQDAQLQGERDERRFLWLGGAVIAVLASFTAVLDPYLSGFLPLAWWDKIFLAAWPYKFSVLILALLVFVMLVIQLLRRLGYHAVLVVSLFVTAQTNGFRVGILDPFDALILVALLVWLAQQLLLQRQPVRLPGLLFFALALLLLDLFHLTHQNPVRFMIGFLGLLRVVMLAFLVVNIIQNEASIRLAVKSVIAVAVLSALVGIGQILLFMFAGIPFTLIDGVDTIFKPTPLGMVMRASGFCSTVQHFSGFLLFGLVFLLFLIPQWNLKRHRLLGCVAVLLILVAILLTWNYGAIFVTVFIVLLFPFIQWPKCSLHIGLAYLTLALVCYHLGVIEWIYSVSFGDSGVLKGLSQRHTLMALGFEKIWRDPLIGTGLRDFAGFSGNFWHRPVHNAYMQAATEIGLLAMLLLIAMLFVLLTQLVLALRHAPAVLRPILKAAVVCMVALILLMMSEPMFDHSNTWLFLGLCQSIVLLAFARVSRPTGHIE